MLNVRFLAPALAGLSLFLTQPAPAGTFVEDFSTDPTQRGWRQFGDTNLFAWNSTNQNLQVTWDSSQTNSYFFRNLGTVLTKGDDFALEFDLRLSDISTNTKTGPFEIAVGFFNLAEATQPGFWRGSGIDPVHGPRDLAEFDYFPAGYYAGYGPVDPTVSPTLVDSNNAFASGFALLELTTNDLFHVATTYTSSNQTLHTVLTRNGSAYGPVDDVVLDTNFSDVRLDTFSISSYSDVGDDYDSVLAHGVIDNVSVTVPPPPVQNLTGGFTNGEWQVQFTTLSNWVYTVERTADFVSWTTVEGPAPGTNGTFGVTDANPPSPREFYRVRAQRP